MIIKKPILLILLTIFAQTSKAQDPPPSLFSESGDGTHFMKHFITSSVIYTGLYLFTNKKLRCFKMDSFIFSAFTTLLIGFTYKYVQGLEEGYVPPNLGKAMLFNGIGVAIPAMILVHF